MDVLGTPILQARHPRLVTPGFRSIFSGSGLGTRGLARRSTKLSLGEVSFSLKMPPLKATEKGTKGAKKKRHPLARVAGQKLMLAHAHGPKERSSKVPVPWRLGASWRDSPHPFSVLKQVPVQQHRNWSKRLASHTHKGCRCSRVAGFPCFHLARRRM